MITTPPFAANEYDRIQSGSDGIKRVSFDVATLDTGEFLVAWSVNGSDDYGSFAYNIAYVQVYDKHGQPVLETPYRPIGSGIRDHYLDIELTGTTNEDLVLRQANTSTTNFGGSPFSLGGLIPDNFYDISAISDSDAGTDAVREDASDRDTIGVTLLAEDDDPDDSVTYALVDDAGGRFVVDPLTGVVTAADVTLIDYESAQSHIIEVTATSTDGSESTTSVTVNVTDVNEAPVLATPGPVTLSVDESISTSTVIYRRRVRYRR